jgi:hypothetical protein
VTRWWASSKTTSCTCPGFHIARTSTGAAGMAEVVYPLGDLEMKALAHYVSRLH